MTNLDVRKPSSLEFLQHTIFEKIKTDNCQNISGVQFTCHMNRTLDSKHIQL